MVYTGNRGPQILAWLNSALWGLKRRATLKWLSATLTFDFWGQNAYVCCGPWLSTSLQSVKFVRLSNREIWHSFVAALIGLVTLTLDLLTSEWVSGLPHMTQATFLLILGFVCLCFRVISMTGKDDDTRRWHQTRSDKPTMRSRWSPMERPPQNSTSARILWPGLPDPLIATVMYNQNSFKNLSCKQRNMSVIWAQLLQAIS